MICIVESWLSSKSYDCEIPGFQLYHFDRHHHGGGVLMYVSDEFLVSILHPPSIWKSLLYLFCLLILNFTKVYFIILQVLHVLF